GRVRQHVVADGPVHHRPPDAPGSGAAVPDAGLRAGAGGGGDAADVERAAGSGLFVVLDPLEDEDDVGRALGGEVLRPISLRTAGTGHANGPPVALQLVNAVLLFPLLLPGLVVGLDGPGILPGIDGDREAEFLFWRLARGLAIGCDDNREVRDFVPG